MKVFDTLMKVDIHTKCENSREYNGLIYAYCHEKNIVAKKSGDSSHFFVFSNATNSNFVIKRSLTPNDSLEGVSVTYDTEKYPDYILFQGLKEDSDRKIKLSDNYTRFIFNQKNLSKIKKVIATSGNGKRPISICRTEFRGITPSDTHLYLNGYGGRLSYGCGLLIPTKVYAHLMNFVK